MEKLLFLSRVAFICNICLLLSWLTQFISFLPAGIVSSTVLMLGLGLSIVFNFFVNIALLIVLLRGRSHITAFPRWLIIANLFFLIPQIILLTQ